MKVTRNNVVDIGKIGNGTIWPFLGPRHHRTELSPRQVYWSLTTDVH